MQPKPEYFGTHYAEVFKQQQVVVAYRHRAPYPPEVFDILASLIADQPRAVLDVGAGAGDIARNLAERIERVDAVDFSHNMIERGKQLPNGKHPNLHWIYGKLEEVPLSPPYALITAGSSIHWTEWPVAFPRFRAMLSPNGLLALIYRHELSMPWDAEIRRLRAQYSTHRGIHGSHGVSELIAGGFLQKLGEKTTAPIPFNQSFDDFIEGLHSRSSLARELMGAQKAAEFDQKVRAILTQFHQDGMLPLRVVGTVTWGKPVG